MRQHPDIEALLRVARDDADEQERSAVLTHCASCSDCGDQLAVAMLLREPSKRQASVQAAPVVGPGRRRWARYLAVAAMLILSFFAGALAFSVWSGTGKSSEAAAELTEERAQILEAWAGFATDENAHPRTYDFIKRVLNLERIRMADSDWVPLMRRAIDDLDAENYDAALDKFQQLALDARVSPTDLAAFIGITRYLKGENSEDVEVLLVRGAETHVDTLQELCHWYLGNLLFKRSRPEEGIVWLAVLADRPTRVGRQAADLIDRLPTETLDPKVLRTVE